MQKTILTTFILLICLQLYSQQKINWSKSYGSESMEQFGSMIIAENSNILLAGSRQVSEEDSELVVMEIDSTGKFISEIKVQYPESNMFINQIINANNGGDEYIIIGSLRPRMIDSRGFNLGTNNYLAVKINLNGDVIWSKTYGGSLHDQAFSVVSNVSGYILAGTSGSTDGDIVDDIGSNDFWLIWINEEGELINSKSLGGNNSDQLSSMIKTKSNDLILAGHSFSFINNGNEADFWVVKTDIFGEEIWNHTIGGTNPDFSFYPLELENGDLILAGESRSNDHDINMDNHGEFDFVAFKLDSEGLIIWSKSYGGSEWDRVFTIEKGSNNNIYLGGFTRSNDGDIQNGHLGGANDYWVININEEDGSLIWENNYGGSGGDILTDIISDGNSLLIGGFSYSNDGNVPGDNNGDSDFLIINLEDQTTSIFNITPIVNEINVYPNPSIDKLFFENNYLGYKAFILNSNGSIIDQFTIDKNYIDIEKLLPSIYYLKLFDSDSNKIFLTKIIKP